MFIASLPFIESRPALKSTSATTSYQIIICLGLYIILNSIEVLGYLLQTIYWENGFNFIDFESPLGMCWQYFGPVGGL